MGAEEILAYPSWGAKAVGQIQPWGVEEGEENGTSHLERHHPVYRSEKKTHEAKSFIQIF